MITYIIKSGLCSLLLLLVYRFILQREKMYAFNRAYLLFSIVFSLVVPLITIQVTSDAPALWEEVYFSGVWETPANAADPVAKIAPQVPAVTSAWSPGIIASWLYAAIALILLCRFIVNLYSIWKTTIDQPSRNYGGALLILSEKTIPAHSFLHYIFMSKADYNDPHVRETLLTHELSHVRQKHSWDILFVETLQIFWWLNPTLYFYKKAIQLNHELLADDTVIHTHGNIRGYQHLLLDKINQQQTITPLTSSFNYFITKKRLAMMTKQPNNKRIACLQCVLLPLFGCTVLLFTGRTYAQTPPLPVQPTPKKQGLSKTYDAKETTKVKFASPGGADLPPGKGATPEQIERFNTIFRNTTVDSKGRQYHYTNQDVKWIKPIYMAMNEEQRKQYPTLYFMNAPVRRSPTPTQLQEWTNASQYGIWMDGKRIENQALANYKATDIALFTTSRLNKNAINYGKHYVQVDLNTKEWYDKYYAGVTDIMVVVELTRNVVPPPSK